MNNKHIPPAVGEFAVGERDQLLARIAEQAREIERLRLNIADYNEHERCYQAEIAALKAQPSGVVLPELRTVVTDAFMGMIAAVTSTTPPADQPPPPFIQSAIDRAVDRIGRLNSSPVSAGDENSEDGLEEWAKGKFGVGGRYTGKLYGNTDWALARVVWSAALSAPSHGEQVRHLVPAGWIPVSERLPQIKQVLSEKCTLEGREIPTLYRSGLVLTFDGRHVSAGIVEWFHAKSPISGVTHWMPLPAAPSAGSQGGDV